MTTASSCTPTGSPSGARSAAGCSACRGSSRPSARPKTRRPRHWPPACCSVCCGSPKARSRTTPRSSSCGRADRRRLRGSTVKVEGPRRVALVAAVVGAASLGAEIAAARLLAPWFGASTIVWANTIATVLVALSVGYWVGGRVADRDPTFRGLCRVVLLAAALMAAVPFVAGPFLRVSVDALDHVQAGAFAGSLVAVLVLIAAPVLVLGCVAPYAVRLSVGAVDEAGRVAGRLYAISTLGSLAGVFLSALVLIPLAGTRRTFLALALSLAIVAVPALGRRFVLAPLALAALIAIPVGTGKATGDGRVIWDTETEYQYARVVQAGAGERTLELNEGQAIHSEFRPGEWLTGDYWDEMLVLPFAASAQPPRSVAILGNAAGTTARAYGHFFPRARVDAVEIDRELSDVGRRLF